MRFSDSTPFNDALSDSIEDRAGDWMLRREAGLTAAEEEDFQRWLAADPRHGRVLAKLESVWAAANRPRQEGRGGALEQAVAEIGTALARRRRRRLVWSGVGLAAAAAVVLGFLLPQRIPSTDALASTVALRPDQQTLPDGTVIELNAGAELTTEFTAERRLVRLLQGEALFQVAKDEKRPFVVTAAAVEVRAVGTAFAVRYEPAAVNILVTEGRVAVAPAELPPSPAVAPAAPEPPPAPVLLDSGNRVVLPLARASELSPWVPPAPAPVTAAEVESALAWRTRRVEFTGTPLAAAIKLFNRDNELQLEVADAATARIRITGVFWTDDPEAFARLLTSSLGIRSEVEPGRRILLQQ